MNRGKYERAKAAKEKATKAKAAKVRAKLNQDRAKARQGAAEANGNAPDLDTSGGADGMSDDELQARMAQQRGDFS